MDDLDFQGGGGGSATDEELTLPKATLAKLIQELLPSDIQTTKETRDLLGDCCVEFIHLLSSEANEISERESKKTISGEHVIQALKSLGFDDYVTDMEEVMQEHTKSLKEKEKRLSKLEASGMTEEEIIQKQEELFAQARQRMSNGGQPSAS